MEALENSASAEMAESKRRFSHVMETILEPHVAKSATKSIDATHINAVQLADFVVHTTMGHKAKATSEEHLEQLLGTLKTLVLKSVDD